jgi:Protein of unknown function (DUF1236)
MGNRVSFIAFGGCAGSPTRAGAILLALVCAASTYTGAGIRFAGAQSAGIEELVDEHGVTPKFELTSAQRHAIYQDLHKERSKLAPSLFAARVGADVPPIIELHALPDHVLASNPETKLYKFTKVDDQVVLVDPTNRRVIAVSTRRPRTRYLLCPLRPAV